MSVMDEVRSLAERALEEADALENTARLTMDEARRLRAFARAAGVGTPAEKPKRTRSPKAVHVPATSTLGRVANAILALEEQHPDEGFTAGEVVAQSAYRNPSPVRAAVRYMRDSDIVLKVDARGKAPVYKVRDLDALHRMVANASA